jgi:hypothetical protein
MYFSSQSLNHSLEYQFFLAQQFEDVSFPIQVLICLVGFTFLVITLPICLI